MHDGVSRSACLSEASCAKGSDHAWNPGQLYWAALSFLCFVSFLGRPRKEMKFPNGLLFLKRKYGKAHPAIEDLLPSPYFFGSTV